MNVKREFVLLFVLIMPLYMMSQDLIVFRNGNQLECKITKTDSLSVYYSFKKNDRTIESFVSKDEIRTYHYNFSNNIAEDDTIKAETIVIDTTIYVKKSSHWVNVVTVAPRIGIHAGGWSLQYSGFILKTDSKWVVPLTISIESSKINDEYFYQSGYEAVSLRYSMVGISPLRRLNKYFYANFGVQLLLGSEELYVNNYYTKKAVYGLVPCQGIFFIPASKFGISFGIGIYEKLLTSEVYKNDVGLQFEAGLKF